MTTNNTHGDDPSDGTNADDRIDQLARAAGSELRRPPPEHGLAGVRGARRNRQFRNTAIGSTAALALLIGGFAVVTSRSDGENVRTSDTEITVPDSTSSPVATQEPETPSEPTATPEPVTSELAPSTAVTVVPDSTVEAVVAGVLSIPNRCDAATTVCTQLANTPDGRVVALDPGDDTLRIYDALGSQLLGEIAIVESVSEGFPDLVYIGPGDVAYVGFNTPGTSDPSRDLIAVALGGPNAGTTVQRWTGLDGSGDSSIVPRRTGLAVVNCCGLKELRPAPDAVLYPFVDSTGAPIQSAAPTFEVSLGDTGNTLQRIDGDGTTTAYPLPTVFQYPRDFPVAVGTDDGGALAFDYVDGFGVGVEVFVRFRPTWNTDGFKNSDVYFSDQFGPGDTLLETTGTVVVASGDTFVRRNLDEIATPGWDGDIIYDLVGGALSTPGLNDAIDERLPLWAIDPYLFALQIVPALTPGASVQVEFDEATEILTITTTGVQYDQISTERVTVQTERTAAGLLHVVDATYAWQCQPGAGPQDFGLEKCF
jgi:hypothetical protein